MTRCTLYEGSLGYLQQIGMDGARPPTTVEEVLYQGSSVTRLTLYVVRHTLYVVRCTKLPPSLFQLVSSL